MRRARLIAAVSAVAALLLLCAAAGARAAGPAVTLDDPQQNEVITHGQPNFSGTAGNGALDSSMVTVRVFAGDTAAGTPVQTLTTTRTDTSYSVAPSSPLADDQYTAQAEQDDALGEQGFSQPVTFIVHNALPNVSLDPPASNPFLSPMPILSGTGGTAYGDSPSVGVFIYPGTNTSQRPIETLTATRDASTGAFSVQVAPGLSDGQYSAVAAQSGVAGAGVSAARTFRIKAHAPAVTLDQPAPGSSTTDLQPLFSGSAGTVPGDAGQLHVTLYNGDGAGGDVAGTATVTASGSRWSLRWPTRLAVGRYTVQASQSDDAGHTGLSAPHSFRIIAAPSTIGSSVKLAHHRVSVPVTCGLPAGQSCSGTILILTQRKFRPVAAGPRGQLRLLFAYVTIAGGRTQTVANRVTGNVARALRHAHRPKLRVTAALGAAGGAISTQITFRRLAHP